MKNLLTIALFTVAAAANAGTITIGGVDQTSSGNGYISSVGTCTIDFNDGTAGNDCGAAYTLAAGNIVQGSVSGQYASPSGDTSRYLSVGPSAGSPVTVMLEDSANYFGFYAGSLDDYNSVSFYLDDDLVDSFTGDEINQVAFHEAASGNQQQAVYINYYTTGSVLFNKVLFESDQNAFETDNHSFAVATPEIPLPGSVALLGLGLISLAAARRYASCA